MMPRPKSKLVDATGFWGWADRHPVFFVMILFGSYMLHIPLADEYQSFKHPEMRKEASKLDSVQSTVIDINERLSGFIKWDSLDKAYRDRRIKALEDRSFRQTRTKISDGAMAKNTNGGKDGFH